MTDPDQITPPDSQPPESVALRALLYRDDITIRTGEVAVRTLNSALTITAPLSTPVVQIACTRPPHHTSPPQQRDWLFPALSTGDHHLSAAALTKYLRRHHIPLIGVRNQHIRTALQTDTHRHFGGHTASLRSVDPNDVWGDYPH